MMKNCSNLNSVFIKGMTATKKKQPDNHILNQKKTRKVVV